MIVKVESLVSTLLTNEFIAIQSFEWNREGVTDHDMFDLHFKGRKAQILVKI